MVSRKCSNSDLGIKNCGSCWPFNQSQFDSYSEKKNTILYGNEKLKLHVRRSVLQFSMYATKCVCYSSVQLYNFLVSQRTAGTLFPNNEAGTLSLV